MEDIVIQLKAQVETYQRNLRRAEESTRKFARTTERASKQAAESMKGIERASHRLAGTVGFMKTAIIGYLTYLGTRGAYEFGRMAADAERLERAYKRLMESQGIAAEEMLENLERLAMGTIHRIDLMVAANKAALLGIPIDKLDELLQIAIVRAEQMGLTYTQAFDDIVTGLGRASPLILDNLGLTVDATEANRKYAEQVGKSVKELTKQERIIALTNSVIERSQRQLEEYRKIQDETIDAREWEKVSRAAKELRIKIGELVGPIILDGLRGMLLILDDIESVFNEIAKASDETTKSIARLSDIEVPPLEFVVDEDIDIAVKGIGASVEELTEQLRKAQEETDILADLMNRFGQETFDTAENILRQIEAWEIWGPRIERTERELEGLEAQLDATRRKIDEIEEAVRRRARPTAKEREELKRLTEEQRSLEEQLRKLRHEEESIQIIERQGGILTEEQIARLRRLDLEQLVLRHRLDEIRHQYHTLNETIRNRGEMTEFEIAQLEKLRAEERTLMDTINAKEAVLRNMEETLKDLTGQTITWRDEIAELKRALEELPEEVVTYITKIERTLKEEYQPPVPATELPAWTGGRTEGVTATGRRWRYDPEAPGTGFVYVDTYQQGGPVIRTGPAIVERGEYILSRQEVAELKAILREARVFNVNIEVIAERIGTEAEMEELTERITREISEKIGIRGGW